MSRKQEIKKQVQQPVIRRLYETLKKHTVGDSRIETGVFGEPKEIHSMITTAKVPVLGTVEQNYGIYKIPSFRQEVNTFWNDPLINEAITMFAEQVVATGAFLTYNPEYILKLDGKTAFDIIKEWYDENNIDTKLLEIAIELKAFGNSFWRITEDFGFTKIAIEGVWHMVRVDPEIPLQEKYNLQLHPMYGGYIMEAGTFIHFKRAITGYHAPFGHGILFALLANPVDSQGNVAPSVYDIRLSQRASMEEGFRKFSFGNVWIGVPNLSNEDFASQGLAEKVAGMSSTGNRIITNSDIKVELEVPERTQSYDAFIKNMRDEFFMSLADPSLKLGLEQGFTKATSVTASEVYKYKIATHRKIMKEKFEDLFIVILDKLGYNGKLAGITMNFGPEEVAVYELADVYAAQDRDIISREEARILLEKYHKWDVKGPAPEPDPLHLMGMKASITKEKGSTQTVETMKQHQEESMAVSPNPQIVVTPLNDALARYSGNLEKIYYDPLVPTEFYDIITPREIFVYQLIFQLGYTYEVAEQMGDMFERTKVVSKGMDYEVFSSRCKEILKMILSRSEKIVNPSDVVVYKGDK